LPWLGTKNVCSHVHAMLKRTAIDKLLEATERSIASFRRLPISTYRLQFNNSFTFRDAAKVVPYLHNLGITDCYASPYLKARTGSLHGYDVSDYNTLNPEVGTWAEYLSFVRQLRRHAMGQILDFVPNHMSLFDNPWWTNILENGPSSPYAEFFDIDWYPAKAELREKVLLPILEDHYGAVLQAGELRLSFDQGSFRIRYRDRVLPIDPKTAVSILEPCLGSLPQTSHTRDKYQREIRSIIAACHNLPERSTKEIKTIDERQRKNKAITKRLRQLAAETPQVRAILDRVVGSFNGIPGRNTSFNALHELLEAQAYRLAYWRVASDEVNYRRFFNINELVGLRMEIPEVFEKSHRLVLRLIRENMVTGLRIDHIDGLFSPADYLWSLQKNCLMELCFKAVAADPALSTLDRAAVAEEVLQKFESDRQQRPKSAFSLPVYVIVEKILEENETLPETWPVYGTSGYEFSAALAGIFVDRRNEKRILSTFRRFTGTGDTFTDVVYRSKNHLMKTSMSAEVSAIARGLDRISEGSRQYRDFTRNSQREAIREVIACFPVYRTYIDAYADSIGSGDKAIVKAAIAEAKRRNPALSASIFDFIGDTLLLKYPPDMNEEGRNEQRLFVMKFQQFSGQVMAKGLEDTACYIYNPLVSLNEVGDFPQRFGTSVDEFHRHNIYRQNTLPQSMISTSTHDSKRSEDVRARINVLSEIPTEWSSALFRWSRLNSKNKSTLNGQTVPDRNEECLLYQTLLGTYPLGRMDRKQRDEYRRRIESYMLKAIREAKVHTGWTSPNTPYEQGMAQFISTILDPSPSRNPFLADFATLNRQVACCGMYNSLAQSLLRIFSPGVPDLYQGNELWDFSLVDPDNRRPVDFACRVHLLNALRKEAVKKRPLLHLAQHLVNTKENGQIKLYVIWRALVYRRAHSGLFEYGAYLPAKAVGKNNSRICAFVWQKGSDQLVVVAPRLLARLTQKAAIAPIGERVWADSHLILPHGCHARQYRNIFTDEIIDTEPNAKRSSLPLARVFAIFPVAAMEPL
jgi:(1->4)-alpha-D-glucan 1-alpha-D-glucosylmutase